MNAFRAVNQAHIYWKQPINVSMPAVIPFLNIFSSKGSSSGEEIKNIKNAVVSDNKGEIYQQIINNTSDYIAIIDFKGKYRYVSPSHGQLGYQSEELIGKSIIDMVHPDDRKKMISELAGYAKRIASAKMDELLGIKKELVSLRLNFRFPDKTGDWHDIETVPSIVENSSGKGHMVLLISRDATKRKKTEEIMRESEMRYRALAETAEDIIFTINTYGYVQYVNTFALKWLGFHAEDIIGKQIDRIFSAQDSIRMKENIQKVIKSKESACFDNEFHFAKKDVWLSTNLVPVTDAKGAVNAVFGISRDITLRRISDEELKKTKDRLEEAERIAGFGNWEWDVSTNELVWSEQVYLLYGLDPEKDKPTYKTVIDTLLPEYRKEFADAIEDALKNDKHFELESGIMRPDGTRRYTHTIGKVIRDKSGKPQKMFGVVQDITGRKKDEENLLKFKLGLERSTDAVFITDTEGNISYVNPAFEKLYGYKKEEAIGKTPRIIKSGVIPDGQYKQFWDALLAKQTISGEIINKTKGGALLNIDGSNNPIISDSGKIIGFIGIHHDITKRKKTEDALKEDERRYRTLFEGSIFSLWEEDLSDVKKFIDSHKLSNVADLRAHFKDNPEDLETCAKMVRLVDVNKATIDFYETENKDAFISGVGKIFLRNPHGTFEEEIFALSEGKKVFQAETKTKTLEGKEKYILMRVTIADGCEKSWARVIISFIDITERKKIEDELKKKVDELEQFNKMIVGRELKMIELKKRIDELERELKAKNNRGIQK